jgi:AraC-like DNA-binding protein
VTRFGPWSTLLALGALFGLTVAILLWVAPTNRSANRLLAALIGVIALKLGPYILGFAGYYDAYPWLSFAPFDLGLAIGPLLWLYVRRLTTGVMPQRAWRHLLPSALQLAYGLVLLPLPLGLKSRWNDSVHARWIDPAETLLEAVSIAVYLVLAWRGARAYQAWLDDHVSNREEIRLGWLRYFLVALAVMLAVWAPYEAIALLAHFNYYQRFPLYVGLTLLVYYLGLEGWRHAAGRYPLPTPAETVGDAVPTTADDPRPAARDWRADGERWLAQLAEAGWWRDPELSLERLARLLGTNTAYLSRAFNDGLGLSFNEAVNRQRVAALQLRLADPDEPRDLLTLAFEAGFSSKTSFNRVFKSQTGQTPSQFRQGHAAVRAKS